MNCEVTDSSGIVKLDCRVGYIYVDHLSKVSIYSFCYMNIKYFLFSVPVLHTNNLLLLLLLTK